MSSRTPNIDLVLPVGSEHVSRAIINENNTKIDTFAGTANSSLNTLSEQTGKFFGGNKQWITNAELNEYQTTGIYMISTGSTIAGVSSGYSWFVLFVYAPRSDTMVQIMSESYKLRYREYRLPNGWNDFQPLVQIKTSSTLTTSGLSSNISSATATYEMNGRNAIIHFSFTSNTQIAVGANVTFTINGLTIYGNGHGCGYSGNTAGIASLANGGSNKINVNVRIIGEPMVSGYSMSCSVPIIVDE